MTTRSVSLQQHPEAYDSIRLVFNTDINDIVDAAEEIGESTDYVLESALEHAKERADELSDLAESGVRKIMSRRIIVFNRRSA